MLNSINKILILVREINHFQNPFEVLLFKFLNYTENYLQSFGYDSIIFNVYKQFNFLDGVIFQSSTRYILISPRVTPTALSVSPGR